MSQIINSKHVRICKSEKSCRRMNLKIKIANKREYSCWLAWGKQKVMGGTLSPPYYPPPPRHTQLFAYPIPTPQALV